MNEFYRRIRIPKIIRLISSSTMSFSKLQMYTEYKCIIIILDRDQPTIEENGFILTNRESFAESTYVLPSNILILVTTCDVKIKNKRLIQWYLKKINSSIPVLQFS